MAEERNWLDPFWGLLSAFSPAAAEAKVVARDTQAQQLVDAIASGKATPHTPPERQQLYQDVLRTAQARPETVSVGYENPWTAHPLLEGAYNPEKQQIMLHDISVPWDIYGLPLAPPPKSYQPSMSQDTLVHELQHFLYPLFAKDIEKARPDLKQTLRDILSGTSLEEQGNLHHALINFVQGQARGFDTANMSLWNKRPLFQRPPETTNLAQQKVLEEAMRMLLKNPALLQQALQGLRAR